MKFKLLLGCLFLPLTVFAEANLCEQLPGHWQGQFSFKNTNNCHPFTTCTVSVKAYVTQLNATRYDLHYEPVGSRNDSVPFTCESSRISIPAYPGTNFDFQCSQGQCVVTFVHSKVYGKMAKVK